MITGEDPEREEAAFKLMYQHHYSLYLTHFYGDKGYRETLRVALTGAIVLAVDSSFVLGETSETCQDFRNPHANVAKSMLSRIFTWI